MLTLLLIELVEQYRKYDAAGNLSNSEYAEIFEEECRRIATQPRYQVLYKEVDVQTDAT